METTLENQPTAAEEIEALEKAGYLCSPAWWTRLLPLT